MEKYIAQIASEGIAIGLIYELDTSKNDISKKCIHDIVKEKARYQKACETAISQIDFLCQHSIKDIGEVNVAVFESHKMLLKDNGYNNSILAIIENESVNAEYAVSRVTDKYIKVFEDIEEDYFKERAIDMRDIGDRLLDCLQNVSSLKLDIEEECILVADNLSPSQTLKMDKSKILAVVIRNGSINSHAAILARALGIPALIGVKVPEDLNGQIAIVDALYGQFFLNPNTEILDKALILQENVRLKREAFVKYKGLKPETKSGKSVSIVANVGGLSDILSAFQNGADGIGLFRTEFVYLEQEDFPSEDVQFEIYKKAAQIAQGKNIIIRTLDIGADKILPYFKMQHEQNPALGYRGIRVSLKHVDIFKVQLRALLRATVLGNISILIPMVNDVDEIIRVKAVMDEIKSDFQNEDIPFGEYKIGVMIETPASVMMAPELAREVDFFSIGTNDLTQYGLAIDRENSSLHNENNIRHPAIMKMIRMVVQTARSQNKIVGICGEVAADFESIKEFIDLGVNMLSVDPHSILPMTKFIRELE